MPKGRLRVGFIGAGRVANALALGLTRAGYDVVAIASRGAASAQALSSKLSACTSYASPQDVVDASDLVFIATPDIAIRSVCESLTWREGVSVVHTSGAETRDALEAAQRQGAATGSFHPLQTFADLESGAGKLAGIVYGVEAEGALLELLQDLAEELGGIPVVLHAEDKAMYHASAVLASNYVVSLMKMSTDLWLRLGWEQPAALQALLPLLKGAVANLENLGLPAALTGPIARGDVDSVRRHLEALAETTPELLPAYRELALQTIPVALAKGGLSDEAAAELRSLLHQESPIPSTEGAIRL